jgi:hypothetical protein
MLFPRVSKEEFQRNITETPDVTPPWFPVLESVPDRQAHPGFFPVRAHVLDNDSWMRTRFALTRIECSVNGVELPVSPAAWAGGQVFRAQLPANLVGEVSWRYVATDEHGNTGSPAWHSYSASVTNPYQVPYGIATAGLAGGPPQLRALSVPLSASVFYLALSSGAPTATPSVIVIGSQSLNPGLMIPGLLYLQVFGTQLLLASGSLGSGGDHVLSLPLGQVLPGLSVFAQGFVLDPTAGGQLFASSQGLQIITH